MVIHVCCWTDADHHGCCERHREWSLLASDSLLRLMWYQHKGEAPPWVISPFGHDSPYTGKTSRTQNRPKPAGVVWLCY